MRKLLRVLLVAAVTLLLLALFLRNSDLNEVLEVMRQAKLSWVAAALVTNFSALLFRTARWRAILTASAGRPTPLYDTFLSTAIGFFSSAVLPIRAGDVIRPALLSRRTGIRFTGALAAVVSERLIDLMAVLSMVVVFSLTGGRELSANPATARKALIIHSGATVAGAGLAAVLLLLVVLYFFRGSAHRIQLWIAGWLPKRFRRGWIGFFDSLHAVIELLGRPLLLARVLAFTACIWVCLTGQFILVLYALDRPLPYISSFLVTGMTILGLWIPTPGGVGGFHKAAQMALTNFYGFDVSASVAVAIVFHLIGTVPVVLTGFALFAKEGMSVKQLARIGASASAEIVDEPPLGDNGETPRP